MQASHKPLQTFQIWFHAGSCLGMLTGGKARCAHLDDGHAHEPEQAPALLIVLLRHAHRALAVLGHVRLAAGLPASAQQEHAFLY